MNFKSSFSNNIGSLGFGLFTTTTTTSLDNQLLKRGKKKRKSVSLF